MSNIRSVSELHKIIKQMVLNEQELDSIAKALQIAVLLPNEKKLEEFLKKQEIVFEGNFQEPEIEAFKKLLQKIKRKQKEMNKRL